VQLATMKNKLCFIGVNVIAALLQILPARAAVALGRFVGVIAGQFFKREREIMDTQLKFAFGDNDTRVRSTPNQTFSHVGETVVESFILPKLLRSRPAVANRRPSFYSIETKGHECVDYLLDNNLGAIALSAHIGSFELLAAFHVRYGAKVSVIGRLPNYPALARTLGEMRTDYGVQTIWRNDRGAAAKLIAAIKNKHFIAVLLDQDTALENNFSNLMGLPAAVPVLPVKLAIKYNLPIFSTFIVRTAPLKHLVISERLHYDANGENPAQFILDEYNRRFEKLVFEYPGQWVWWHRRWRRRPGVDYAKSNNLPSTQEYIQWLSEQRALKHKNAETSQTQLTVK